MKVEVVVPQIGEAVAALKLTNWLKAVGDPVKKGDVLFEIDSDKAIVEVESFVDGTLAEILAPADSDVMPQQVVARIEAAGDEGVAAAPASISTAPPPPDQRGNGHKASPVAQRLATDLGVDLGDIAGSGPGGRIVTEDVRQFAESRAARADGAATRLNASPKARRLSREMGVDLSGLRAAHPDGMIRVRDVEKAAKTLAPAASAPGAASAPQPLSKLRQTVAQRTQASKQTVPHFYLMVDVDMTQAEYLRDYCRGNPAWDRPPTYTDLLLRACALALAEMPSVNRSYDAGGLAVRGSINIGVAVDSEAGLVVPVIAGVDRLGLREVSLALRGAAERARKGTLKPGDLGEKSMVISNLGMYAVNTFIAIIDQPDPMILAVGRVADRLAPLNGQPVVLPMCTLTLSADHRVLDGAQAARFLERIKSHLENPYALMG
jgi:pyruvate dehydrogenase E2 component (dihydrolipoamide acetyltransferase)